MSAAITRSPCNHSKYCNDTDLSFNDTYTDDDAYIGSVIDIGTVVRIVVLGVLTLFGNLLVVLSVVLNDELRAPRYAYIASLATVDALSGVYIAVGAMHNSAPEILDSNPQFCVTIFCCLYLLWSTSIFHMVLIAIDRYLTITNPFTYEMTMTKCRCSCFVAGAWLCGATVAALPLLGWRPPLPPYIACIPSFVLSGEYLMFVCFGVFFLPLIAMCVLYGRLARIALQQRRKIDALHASVNAAGPSTEVQTVSSAPGLQPEYARRADEPSALQPSDAGQPSQPTQQSRLKTFKREMRTTKTLSMILGVFALCWLPFSFMLIAEYTVPGFYNHTLNNVAFSLGMANSAINPVLYALRDIPLRKTFKKILKCQRV